MQVPSPCCKSCSKRISSLQISFRRMRIGRSEREDVLRLLMLNPSYDDIFGNTFEEREESRKKIILLTDEDLRVFLEDNGIYEPYSNIFNKEIDAITAFRALDVERPCCKRDIVDPPIWPIFSPNKPLKSILRTDTGERKRLVVRNGNGYTISSIDVDLDEDVRIEEEIPISVDEETTREIEELDV